MTTRDNALAETVIGLYKSELINPTGPGRPLSKSRPQTRGGPVSLVELRRSGVGGDADDAVVVIEIDLGAAVGVERDGVCAWRRFGDVEFLPVDGIEEPE